MSIEADRLVCAHWRQADEGIWEVRGGRQRTLGHAGPQAASTREAVDLCQAARHLSGLRKPLPRAG
jgi:hypothetical protein